MGRIIVLVDSRQDLAREVIARGVVAQISGATIWRWLDQDAIRPWQHRSWIFPRDPQFERKAGRVLIFTKVAGKTEPWAAMST